MTFWRDFDFAQGYATSGSSRGWDGLRLLAFRFWQCLQLGGEPEGDAVAWG